MKKILFFFIVFSFTLNAQTYTITPSVINTAGKSYTVNIGSGTYQIDDNIGETFVTTLNSGTNVITQGFLQPEIVLNNTFVIVPITSPESCLGANDGKIHLEIKNTLQPTYTVSYIWASNLVCTDSNCSSVNNLAPGVYSFTVTVKYPPSASTGSIITHAVSNTLTITQSQEACSINVYNGITPNGDGFNDGLWINNIEVYPNNTVEIYNRWGQQIAQIKNYDNVSNNWKGTIGTSNDIAPDGTYFYIIDLNNGSKVIKGFIELTK